MSTKIKVLLLLHELSRTGAPKIALDLLDVLGGELEVRSITIRGGPLADRCAAHGPCKILAEDWSIPRWKRPIHRVRNRLWKRGLRRWSPDLIYVNSIASLPIATMVPLPDVPAILHVHELHTHLEVAMNDHPDLLTRWPSRYIAVSEAVAQALHTDFGIDRERIALIHAFIPARDFERVEAAPPPQPGVGFVVGGAGLPSWRKGTVLWLQMVAEVRRLLGPSARFVWVGVPEWPAPDWFSGALFRREIKLLGLDGVVELVPSNPKPLEHFARFDVFAMTSWEDPCPLVILEAMMLGKPVVCFAGSGGSPEEIGDSGLIIESFDPLAMARAIVELAGDPEERARLGSRARERVHRCFTDRIQVPKIRYEIEAVMGSRIKESASTGRAGGMRKAPERGRESRGPSSRS